jgi:hypothetical protein
MLSDELDKKLKETTEGYHPAYDEKAWDKMEALLDKHLPLEKKRRRFILLLLPLLLVGTGIFLLLQKPGRDGISEEKKSVIQSESINKQPAQGAAITIPSKTTASKQAAILVQQDIITPASEENKPAGVKLQKQLVSGNINSSSSKQVRQIISQEQQLKQQQSFSGKKLSRKTKDQENNFAEQKPSDHNPPVIIPDNSSVNDIVTPVSNDASASLTEIVKAVEEKKQPVSSETKEAITETKPQKQRSSAASKLSLNLSAGPDISSVGIDNPGKWNLQYGIGFSYALSKKLSIRTGFFAGRKKYSADSTEYHSYYYPPKLQRIDANCLVYEIPLNLIYNFSAIKKHNWFVAGGLSSYLMKKETYDYFYKNAWGQPQYYSHTYKNENSHIFSVINISGGYQYHFTDRLSLMAEPYVRIPVSGIGAGKVKLNSGGILFSISFKPFLKKN